MYYQDTVVGLQALAEYAAKFPANSKRGVDVKLSWKGGMHSFNTIRRGNSDILQQFKVLKSMFTPLGNPTLISFSSLWYMYL